MSIQNFIADIWNAALMEAMYESHIFTQPMFVNRNYEGEVFNQGDTVHITGIEPVSIGSYTRYTDIEFEQINDNTRTLQIDQADFFGLTLDDLDRSQEIGETMGPAMREAGYKISLASDLYVANTMKLGVDSRNVIAPVTWDDPAAAADFETAQKHNGAAIRHAFVELRTRLARNNVPEMGRWAIVTPEISAMLMEDPHFVRADERGSASVVESRNGWVGSMYGFSIFESNNSPRTAADSTAGTPSSHTILAGTNMSYTYADGLSQTEAGRFEKRFADYVKGLHVYGGRVLRPESLCSIEVENLPADADVVTFRDAGWVDSDQSLPGPGANSDPSTNTTSTLDPTDPQSRTYTSGV